jgi:hypothetical protein
LKESTRRGRTGSYLQEGIRFFFCSFAVSVRSTSVASKKNPADGKKREPCRLLPSVSDVL